MIFKFSKIYCETIEQKSASELAGFIIELSVIFHQSIQTHLQDLMSWELQSGK
jgi:hypothetical protein